MKRFTKTNGRTYYSCVLLYVDDAMCINHDTEAGLHKLEHYFKMKPGSIGDPDLYLGGKVCPVELDTTEMAQPPLGDYHPPST